MRPRPRRAGFAGLLAGAAAALAAGCMTQSGPAVHTAAPAAAAVAAQATPWRYPPAARDAVVDDYFGTRVADPYRWLEALDSAQTQRWVRAENQLAQPYLQALPQRAWIRSRLAALLDYARYGVPVKAGPHYFYTWNSGTQDQAVLYVTDDLAQRGRVLLDPNALRRDATVALADFAPDWRGTRVAYALSDGGTDWKSWHVRDVATGQDLPDVLHFTKFTGVSWAHDDSGFYYSRYPARRGAPAEGDDQRQAAVYFHRLGTPQSADPLVYAVTDSTTRVPYATVTDDGRYLVLSIEDGTLTSGVSLLPLAADGSRVAAGATARPLLARWDGLYNFIGSQGDTLYFSTTAQAPHGRVIAVDARAPAPAHWRTVIPESAQTLLQASFVGGRLFAVYLRDAHSIVRQYRPDGTALADIALPGLGTVSGFGGRNVDTQTYFAYTDFFTPTRILRYDLATDRASGVWAPALSADTSQFVTEQVFYPSRDGTRIPMFILHRRGLVLDGNQPVMLYGYGGFDISLTPAYSATALTWLSMGGVYAVANLRGGGEYGEAWHLAGSRRDKQNVFDDFIAAAQYLIHAHYTRPARLAISGASNGGLLIGAAITQRPDLFAAALPAVGVMDMLRYQRASANAYQWSSDYGLSTNPQDFKALYAYSPYHRLQRGTCYPATLVTTADHDDRVVPWHSYKFAARLQYAQGCAHPALIRIETRAGHGAGKPRWMVVDDYADQWAFAAQALGMEVGHP